MYSRLLSPGVQLLGPCWVNTHTHTLQDDTMDIYANNCTVQNMASPISTSRSLIVELMRAKPAYASPDCTPFSFYSNAENLNPVHCGRR